MKKYVFAGLALAFGIAAALFLTRPGEAVFLHVNDVGADPAAYVGTLTVRGVTAAFSPYDRELFGVMDVKELQCQSQNCNKLILPVRFRGGLPTLGDEVRITGRFVRLEGGYLLEADKVAVMKNHKIGG